MNTRISNGMTGLWAAGALAMMAAGAVTSAKAAEMKVWCIHDMAKIDPVRGKAWEENPAKCPKGLRGDYRSRNTVWDAKRGSVKLVAGRNEVVAFQMILEPTAPVKGVTFHATDLAGEAGRIPAPNVMMFREWYLHVTRSGIPHTLGDGWYPDPLIPLRMGTGRYGAPLDIPDPRNGIDGQKNQAVWVDLYVPKDAAPGPYRGAIEIAGPAAARVPIELEVLNVAIPDEEHHMMNLNSYGKLNWNVVGQAMRIKFYQLLQRHRIYLSTDSGRVTPGLDPATGKLDWTEYDKRNGPLLDGTAFTAQYAYGPGPMQGRPVVFFELPFDARMGDGGWPMPFKQAHTPAYEKRFTETLSVFDRHFHEKGWTKTTYILYCNGFDEPTRFAQYKEIRYLGMLARKVNSPLVRFKTDIGHFATAPSRIREFDTLADVMKFMDPAISFWCCNGGTLRNGTPLYDVDILRKEAAKGRLVYYYGTNMPPEQGGSFVDSESLGARVWPLIAARYEITGGEIWHFMLGGSTLFRGMTGDAWKGDPTDAKRRYFGYAQHVYMPRGLGVDFGEPIASIRLKGFRRGQQDAEYFWMARQAGHRDVADRLIQKLVPAALDKVHKLPRTSPGLWPHDPAAFEQARQQLARLLAR